MRTDLSRLTKTFASLSALVQELAPGTERARWQHVQRARFDQTYAHTTFIRMPTGRVLSSLISRLARNGFTVKTDATEVTLQRTRGQVISTVEVAHGSITVTVDLTADGYMTAPLRRAEW